MKIKKILSSLIACTLTVSALPFNGASAENDWRELYREKLNEIKGSVGFSNYSTFDLYDINGDSVPELFVKQYGTEDPYGWEKGTELDIFTVSKGKLVNVRSLDGTGGVYLSFCPETGLLAVNDNFDTITLMRLKGARFIVKDEFVSIGEAKYARNGEPVEYEVYSEAVHGKPDITVGNKYYFGDHIISYALTPQTELTREQKVIYLRKLAELLANHKGGHEPIDTPQFELYDLSGDGVPELSYSPSVSYAGGACTVWTIHNGELVDLGYTGTYGNFQYDAEKNLVYLASSRMGMHYADFFSIDNGKRVTVIKYNTNEQWVTDMNEFNEENGSDEREEVSYQVNDEAVTREEYYSAVEEYEKHINSMWCGRRCVFSVQEIAKAVFGEKSLVPQMIIKGAMIEAVGKNVVNMES